MSDLAKFLDAYRDAVVEQALAPTSIELAAPLGAARAAIEAHVEELRGRIAELAQPGTPEAYLDWIFEFAEKECGHSPVSAKHGATSIVRKFKDLQREVEELRGAIRARKHSGYDVYRETMWCPWSNLPAKDCTPENCLWMKCQETE